MCTHSHRRAGPTLLACLLLVTGVSAQSALFDFPAAAVERRGAAVADAGDVNGDGIGDIAIGKPFDNTAGLGAGACEVRSGADGSVLRTFFGSAAGELFGSAVAGAGDVDGDGTPDLAVGGPGGAGVVRVLSGAAGGGVIFQLTGLTPTDALGASVAAAGDVDGDGLADIIVGSPGEGRARIVGGIGTATVIWNLAPANVGSPVAPAPTDVFGTSVAGVGDLTGDGIPDVVVGAPQPIPTAAGYVTAYSGATGGPIISAVGAAVGDELGASVASYGDVTGDGIPEVLIGAPQSVNGLAGYAAVWQPTGAGSPAFPAPVVAGLVPGQQFGRSVASLGDVNGDLVPDWVGGSAGDGMAVLGSAAVFLGGTSFLFTSIFGAPGDRFGSAVAGLQDLTGDGIPEFIVGNPILAGAVDTGTATVYSPISLPTAQVVDLLGGCGAPAPVLAFGPTPILGTGAPATISVTGAPNRTGILGINLSAGLGVPLGLGCTLWVDLQTAIILPIATDGSGVWSFTGSIPASPQLAGQLFTVQAGLTGSTATPWGFDISNGLSIQYGY